MKKVVVYTTVIAFPAVIMILFAFILSGTKQLCTANFIMYPLYIVNAVLGLLSACLLYTSQSKDELSQIVYENTLKALRDYSGSICTAPEEETNADEAEEINSNLFGFLASLE